MHTPWTVCMHCCPGGWCNPRWKRHGRTPHNACITSICVSTCFLTSPNAAALFHRSVDDEYCTDVGCEQSSSLHARSVLQNELRRVQEYLAQQGVFVRSRLTLHTRLRAKKNASALQDDFSRAFHWLFALGPVHGYNALGVQGLYVLSEAGSTRRWM